MAQTIPKDTYHLIKLDNQFRYLYFNHHSAAFLGVAVEQYYGQKFQLADPTLMPSSFNRFALERLNSNGFINYFFHFKAPNNGTGVWGFMDIGKRYTPEEGKMLGYEIISYPASIAGMDYFAEVYSQMLKLEKKDSGDKGINNAWNFFEQKLKEEGVSYDELVHTLQQS